MDSGTVTTEPTCESIGVITYACQNEGCDYSYTQKLGNLGHRYVDGVCVNCGALEDGTVPQESAAAADVVSIAAQEPASSPAPAADAPVPVLSAARITAAAPDAASVSWMPLFVSILTLASGTSAILLSRRLTRSPHAG